MPQSNLPYWTEKFEATKARDRAVQRTLRREGWATLVVWECKTGNPVALERSLIDSLAKHGVTPRIPADDSHPERPTL
jgi:DNA mismatch endonuclease (patch repair protein)